MFFDLDGTTVDTISDINSALNKTLGSSFTDTECKVFVGNGLRNCVLSALRALGYSEDYIKENGDKKAEELIRNYSLNPVEKSKPYKGVTELLEFLNAKGIKIGIFSNKEHSIFLRVVNTVFPTIKFDFLSGRNWIYAAKPAPEAVLEFVKICGAEKDGILYVGDSEVDYKCACNANVPCLILTNGSRPRDFLLSQGVREDCLIGNISEVYERAGLK